MTALGFYVCWALARRTAVHPYRHHLHLAADAEEEARLELPVQCTSIYMTDEMSDLNSFFIS